jgi:biotin/methionine sulfoxide reductase
MLAGLSVSERVRPGVILVATGAWYTTSEFSGLELAGNPNVLTRDQGASSLSQGCAAQTVLVHVELANPRQS